MIQVLVLNVHNNSIKKTFLSEDTHTMLKELYQNIGCDCIDITARRIDGVWYDLIVDDEGLFRNDKKAGAVNKAGYPLLVGNIVFANHDGEGNTTSLSKEDMARIINRVVYICSSGNHKDGNIAILLDE